MSATTPNPADPEHACEVLNAPSATPVRRYTVYCHHRIGRRYVTRDIVRGLEWTEAKAFSEKMQDREKAGKPLWTSWSGRLFSCRLEK